MKSKSFMLMIVSMGFGLVAAIGISQVMVGKNSTAPEIQMGPVLVAKTDVDIKDLLTEENVTIENWPVTIIPENAATKIEDIADKVTSSRLSKGMPIVISATKGKNEDIIRIPEGFKVVAIKVNADDTLAGLLSPGDRVDVIGLFKRADRTQTTRTFLKGLRVFSIGNRMDAYDDRTNNENSSAIVGVLVTEKQSEEIYFVQRTGQIKLALRGEETRSDTEPESIADIMEEGENATEEIVDVDAPKTIFDKSMAPGTQGAMIVWRGPDAEKIHFQNNDIPIRGSGSRERAPSREDEVSEEDFNGSEDIDRGLEQDQYLSR